MSKFNLNDYETVKQRKKRFYSDFKDGRIIVENITPESEMMEYALFKATIFLTPEDQEKNLPKSTGYAMEVRDKELKVSSYGKEYESVNYSSWTENCEESAVGRALDNAGYASSASREEMEKVGRNSKALKYSTKSTTQQFKPAKGINTTPEKIDPLKKDLWERVKDSFDNPQQMYKDLLAEVGRKTSAELTKEDIESINQTLDSLASVTVDNIVIN